MSMAGDKASDTGGEAKTFTDRNGRTWRAHGPRPYYVRCSKDRWFGSLAAARCYAGEVQGSYSIFFEYAPGTGAFVESSLSLSGAVRSGEWGAK